MRTLIFILFFFITSSFSRYDGDDILGHWIDETEKVIVKCYKVNNKYSAVIKWFDNNNPNKEVFKGGLNKSKWLNYKVMYDFKFNGEYWYDGEIYQVKTGKTYSANIYMKDKNNIVVRGYVLFTLLGEDVKFKRYNGDLPKQL